MVRKISSLNKKINDLRNLMEVVLDANPFTQPITIQQTGAASAGSSKCMGFFTNYMIFLENTYVSIPAALNKC